MLEDGVSLFEGEMECWFGGEFSAQASGQCADGLEA